MLCVDVLKCALRQVAFKSALKVDTIKSISSPKNENDDIYYYLHIIQDSVFCGA